MSKAKEIIKKAYADKPTFGTNPSDPWSAKAGISEAIEQALLMKYLYSRGINPQHVNKDTMIGHSKSGEYMKWKRDHMNTEEVQIDEDDAKKHFTNAMNTIHPQNRDAARKTYQAARTKGLPHAAALSTMWQMHKEGVEQIDELSIDTVKKYDSKLKTGEMPGTIHKAIMRFRGKERAQDRIHSDEMKKMRDRLGLKSESFSKLSKTAQFIKTIYQEAMYDHEKEDKSIQTYGKKPKMEKGDDKENMGEKKPEARATLTGGTTLTGEKRDMIELDPMMRNRPGQPDLTKKKDDKKDGGKEDKKKDK